MMYHVAVCVYIFILPLCPACYPIHDGLASPRLCLVPSNQRAQNNYSLLLLSRQMKIEH